MTPVRRYLIDHRKVIVLVFSVRLLDQPNMNNS